MEYDVMFPKSEDIMFADSDGVVGFAHEGMAYCRECAEEVTDIDTDAAREREEELAWTSVIREWEEWDERPNCSNVECGIGLDVRTIFGE